MCASSVNWITAYNRFFALWDRTGTPTYLGGGSFLKFVQQIDPGTPSYNQLIDILKRKGRSTSRRDYYWDVIMGLQEEQRFRLFRLLIDEFEQHAKDEVDAIRAIVFGGGYAVPIVVVPLDLWNSEKLNNSLRDIDHAIDAQHYNRATTLAYTCIEGLYKAYVHKHVVARSDVSDLIQLCRIVKDDLVEKLKARGPFPEQIVNAIPTMTNAVANSRNGFSESHFADDAQKWLAIFARDMTNSIGRLLLHFI
ncbi:HEPN domain-containing protein [Paraburkholderia sp. JHI869]|uniref:HEPN domain-containing protein n=1 Tax=Paraburkholderia sp. JHI869 TaxID=3112959 RepID=UPI00317BD659